MRIHFPDLSRPKNTAKRLSRLSSEVTLARAHSALARATGYRDWHELAGCTPQRDTAPQFDLERARKVVLALADALSLMPGDVQHTVAKSRLLGPAPWGLEEHLALTASIWRERAFGAPARGKSGTIVKVRAHGETRPAYLQLPGRPTRVVYDTGPGMCADFETITPNVPLPDFVPSRLWLPYGYWSLRDGSEVVFARDYLPMWRITSGRIERLSPWLWIEGIAKVTVFSSDLGTTDWSRGHAREVALACLHDRRIFELPRLVDVMPLLIKSSAESIPAAAELLRLKNGNSDDVPPYARLNDHLAYA